MLEGGRISARQATLFLIATVLATSILFVPSVTVAAAGRDAWLSMLPAMVLGGGIGYLAARLALRFPDETVIQFAPRIIGRVPGKIAGFLYIFLFFFAAYVSLAEFHVLLGTAYLPRTPVVVHVGVLALLVAYLIAGGLEVYTRINGLITPIMVAAILLICTLTLKDIETMNYFPLLEHGPRPVFLGAILPGSWFSETAVILMLVPFIRKAERKQAGKAVLLAVAVLTVILFAVLVTTLGNFGVARTANLLFPAFNLVRSVQFETMPIFSRQDPVFMVTWIAAMLVKVGAFYYVGLLALAQWLNLSSYRPIILPAMVLVTVLAMQVSPNAVQMVEFTTQSAPIILLSILGGLTMLLYAVVLVRGRRKGGGGKNDRGKTTADSPA